MARELSTGDRRKKLLALVRASEFMRIPDLADHFGVSVVTIRSDLDVLADQGFVVRVRGGVIPSSPFADPPFEARQTVAAEEKSTIAEAAAAMLRSGDTLILDVGTTTLAIAQALLEHDELDNLCVFTNALNIALTLRPAIPRIEVMVTGGSLRPREYALVEPGAARFLKDIRADYAFVGCEGIHPARGVTTANLPDSTIKQAMLMAARQRVIVADSSKFLQEGLAVVCELDGVDLVLTAGELDPDMLAEFGDTPEIRVARAAGVAMDG